MDLILRNILFAALFSFALLFDCLYFGIRFDTFYKISPEWNCSCERSEMYGGRWIRLATVLFYLFSGSILAVFIHLRRNEQTKHYRRLSILNREAF